MKRKAKYPDCSGLWHCESIDGEFDNYVVETYPLPMGILCAWCEECGRGDMSDTDVWSDDEWFGHVPAFCLEDDGEWTLIEEYGK